MPGKSKTLTILIEIIKSLVPSEKDFLIKFTPLLKNKEKISFAKTLIKNPSEFTNRLSQLQKNKKTRIISSLLEWTVNSLIFFYRAGGIYQKIVGFIALKYNLSRRNPALNEQLEMLLDKMFPIHNEPVSWKIAMPILTLEKQVYDTLESTDIQHTKDMLQQLYISLQDVHNVVETALLGAQLEHTMHNLFKFPLKEIYFKYINNVNAILSERKFPFKTISVTALAFNWHMQILLLLLISGRFHTARAYLNLTEIITKNPDTIPKPYHIVFIFTTAIMSHLLLLNWTDYHPKHLKQIQIAALNWTPVTLHMLSQPSFVSPAGLLEILSSKILFLLAFSLKNPTFTQTCSSALNQFMQSMFTFEHLTLNNIHLFLKFNAIKILHFLNHKEYGKISDILHSMQKTLEKRFPKHVYARSVYYLWKFIFEYESEQYGSMYDTAHAAYQWSNRHNHYLHDLFLWMKRWSLKLSKWADSDIWNQSFQHLLHIYLHNPQYILIEPYVPVFSWIHATGKITKEVIPKTAEIEATYKQIVQIPVIDSLHKSFQTDVAEWIKALSNNFS